MSKVYHDFGDGWQPVRARNLRIACCDCGLVHVIQVRKRKSGYEMQMERDDKATGLLRRHHVHDCEPRQPRRSRKAPRAHKSQC
jgi:hypothetical protein